MDSQPPPIPFLALPRELRDQIYTYIFSSPEYRDNSNRPSHASLHRTKMVRQRYGWKISRNSELDRVYFPESCLSVANNHKLSHEFPAICSVSKQFFEESVPFYLRYVTVHCQNVEMAGYLVKWLDRFPGEEGWAGVVSLQLSVHSDSVSQKYALVERCTNLRELAIIFVKVKRSDGISTTIEKFAEIYEFDRLIDLPLPKLWKFAFEVRGFGVRVGLSREDGMDTKNWLVKKWEERGRDVVVVRSLLPPVFPVY